MTFLFAAVPATRGAHDIPNDVTVQVFFKPEGQRLRLLVRVPLGAMRDLDYPRRGGGNTSDLLDISRADATLRDAATLWVGDFLNVYENDQKLPYPSVTAVRASLPSDPSFTSYDTALAHTTGPPLPGDMEFFWSQGLLDILFEYPIVSDQSRFSIDPRFARLGIRTLTLVRFLPPGPGPTVRAFELEGDPGLVRLDPTWGQAAWHFAGLGFAHLLDGTDYLLFLVCLAIPVRRVRSLPAAVVSFTIAYSITLVASAYRLAPDALWFAPLVVTLIAASIVYLAFINIVGWDVAGRSGDFVSFGFGLVYGFGFSFALGRRLQFAGSHVLTSVLSFNAGVELGVVLVLLLLVLALHLLFTYVVAERIGTIILSALVGHTAWHWTLERWDILRRFRFEWPALDLAFWVSAMRWAMVLVIAAGLYWLVFSVMRGRMLSAIIKP